MTETAAVESPDGRTDTATPEATPRHWMLVIATTVAIVTLLHLVALAGDRGPILYEDALGYLGNARFLSGGAPPTFDGSPFYAAGYSLLLVPFYWATSRPQTIWMLATLLNVILAIAIMGPGYRMGRRLFGVGRVDALLGAVAVSLTPALLLQPGRVWVETLFPFLFLTATAFVLATARTRSLAYGSAAGLLVGSLILVHGRAMPIAAAFLLFLAAGYVLLDFPALLVAASTTGVVLGFAASVAAQAYLTANLWSSAPAGNAAALDILLTAFSPEHVLDTAFTGLGHAWYVLAASFGVALVGSVSLGAVAARGRSHASTRPEALVAAFALLSTVGVLLLSAGILSDGPRVDHRIYGRYLEGVTPLLILAGVAFLVQKRRAWKALVAGAMGVVIVGGVLAVAGGPSSFVGDVQKLTIPGLVGLQAAVTRSGSVFLVGVDIVGVSLLAAAFGVGIAIVVRSSPRSGVVAMIIVTVALTFVGKTASWDPFVAFWHESFNHIPTALRDSDRDRPIIYDVRFLNGGARNLYEFRLAPRSLTFIDDPCRAAPGDFVISSPGLRGPARDVLELVTIDRVPKQALYIRDDSPVRQCR